MRFQPHELLHLSCFNPSVDTGPCYVALGALTMGDSLAVEIAQQAHFQVLAQLAGSLRETERELRIGSLFLGFLISSY